jgi:hypothetical protein
MKPSMDFFAKIRQFNHFSSNLKGATRRMMLAGAYCLHIEESMGTKRKKRGTIATPHNGCSSMLPAGGILLAHNKVDTIHCFAAGFYCQFMIAFLQGPHRDPRIDFTDVQFAVQVIYTFRTSNVPTDQHTNFCLFPSTWFNAFKKYLINSFEA